MPLAKGGPMAESKTPTGVVDVFEATRGEIREILPDFKDLTTRFLERFADRRSPLDPDLSETTAELFKAMIKIAGAKGWITDARAVELVRLVQQASRR